MPSLLSPDKIAYMMISRYGRYGQEQVETYFDELHKIFKDRTLDLFPKAVISLIKPGYVSWAGANDVILTLLSPANDNTNILSTEFQGPRSQAQKHGMIEKHMPIALVDFSNGKDDYEYEPIPFDIDTYEGDIASIQGFKI